MTARMHRRLGRLESNAIADLNSALEQVTTRAESAEQERDQAALWLNTQARELDAVRRELAELQAYRDRTEAALLDLCQTMSKDVAGLMRDGDIDGGEAADWRGTLHDLDLYRPAPLPAEVLPENAGADPWWKVLGLEDPVRTADALQEAYRAAARRAHPDAGGSQEAFVRVQRAFEAGRDALGGAA